MASLLLLVGKMSGKEGRAGKRKKTELANRMECSDWRAEMKSGAVKEKDKPEPVNRIGNRR